MNDSDFNKALYKLQAYLDAEGHLLQWPAARKAQRIALEYLASHFDSGTQYTEKEMNAILNKLHTFNDPGLLRRELFEGGHFNRNKDGTGYWRAKEKTT
jgi:hypothetical protein